MNMTNKIAIVTGGASGIGLASAKDLIAKGAKVVLADVNQDQGAAAAKSLGPSARFQQLNVADESNWQKVFDATLKQFGRVDYLVNSAGITGGQADIEHEDLKDWETVFGVNATGTFLGIKYAMKSMTNGGAIVNVISLAGIASEPNALSYSASKGAEVMITRNAAVYGATKAQPIRVNAVYPAATKTVMVETALKEHPQVMQQQLDKIPLGKFAEPEDMAKMITFLLSDDAKFITGGDFIVDGGQHVRL